MRPLARAAVAVVAAGIASAAYQRAADAADRRRFPPPGRLADIGGRRIHLLAMGEGTPAVVIFPALGEQRPRVGTRPARPPRARLSVVCDRAGIGWSDPPPLGTLTLDAMADDLHAALTAAGIGPPYIIAGHSLGGIVARRFHARYPGDVTGMLLVDSSHEDQSRRFGWREGTGEQLWYATRRQSRILGARRLAASLGRLSAVDRPASPARPCPEYAGAARAITLSSKQRRIVVREMLLAARLRAVRKISGALPLTVISSANRWWDWWPAGADAGRTGRAVFRHRPHDRSERRAQRAPRRALRVVQAIRDLVDRCRQNLATGLQAAGSRAPDPRFPADSEFRRPGADVRWERRWTRNGRSGSGPGQALPGGEYGIY